MKNAFGLFMMSVSLTACLSPEDNARVIGSTESAEEKTDVEVMADKLVGLESETAKIAALEYDIAQLKSQAANIEAELQSRIIKNYTTGNSGELVSALPGNEEKKVVYSVQLQNLKSGDILVVLGELECTNDSPTQNVRLSTGIRLSNNQDTVGDEITEGNSFNITPAMHHGVAVKVGTIVVDGDRDTAYVNFTAWSNLPLTVEQDYGRLQVIRISSKSSN